MITPRGLSAPDSLLKDTLRMDSRDTSVDPYLTSLLKVAKSVFEMYIGHEIDDRPYTFSFYRQPNGCYQIPMFGLSQADSPDIAQWQMGHHYFFTTEQPTDNSFSVTATLKYSTTEEEDIDFALRTYAADLFHNPNSDGKPRPLSAAMRALLNKFR